jgi:outer membrane protein assembly factor BamD (BamD/ComL family)
MGANDFVRGGALEKYLNEHPNTQVNPPVEYYWAVLSSMANHKRSAEYRFRRILDKYDGSEYAPLAWVGLIDLLDDKGLRNEVIDEGNDFLEKYANHPKADMIKKKILFLQHGY